MMLRDWRLEVMTPAFSSADRWNDARDEVALTTFPISPAEAPSSPQPTKWRTMRNRVS